MDSRTSSHAVPLLSASDIDRLRDALLASGYDTTSFAQMTGTDGEGNVVAPPVTDLTQISTRFDRLVRLFLRREVLPASEVAAALDPLPLSSALAAGLIVQQNSLVAAALCLLPMRLPDNSCGWLLSDHTGMGQAPDAVPGLGGAAAVLIQATPRHQVTSAVDIGIGSGIQALHLNCHARAVTGTDVNPRALRIAATTAALNRMDWELLHGDLTKPLVGRRFDLAVANLPFVVGPGTVKYTYRDSGYPGDEASRALAKAAPRILNEGGYLQYLANWIHPVGQSWQERLEEWFSGTGLDVWILQREVMEPEAYVTYWMRDAGQSSNDPSATEWLRWLSDNAVAAIGFGVITVRNSQRADAVVRIEEMPQQPDIPIGQEVPAWFARQDWLRERPGRRLLAAPLTTHPDLRLHLEAVRGQDGWEPNRHFLGLDGGMAWYQEIPGVVAALLAECDGSTPLIDHINLVATTNNFDPDQLAEDLLPIIVQLVERGMLVPGVSSASSDAPSPYSAQPFRWLS